MFEASRLVKSVIAGATVHQYAVRGCSTTGEEASNALKMTVLNTLRTLKPEFLEVCSFQREAFTLLWSGSLQAKLFMVAEKDFESRNDG